MPSQPKALPDGPSLGIAPPNYLQVGGHPQVNPSLQRGQPMLPLGHPPQALEVSWTSLGPYCRIFCPRCWDLLPEPPTASAQHPKIILVKEPVSAIGSENSELMGSNVPGGGSGAGKWPARHAVFLALYNKDLNNSGQKRPAKAG